jgi:hypothetical protein
LKLLFTVVFLFLAVSAQAQKYRASFGDMPDDEILEALRMTSYPADSAAKALVLYSRDEVELTYVGTKTKRLVRIKIFDKSAYEGGDLANEVLYVHANSSHELKGFSYNLVDGKIEKTRLEESSIFKAKYNSNYNKVSFTLPKVTEGTVIEYFHSEVREGHIRLPSWNLQFLLPSLFNEVIFTPSGGFRSDVRGLLPIKYESLRLGKTHRWYLENAPAFIAEQHMPHEDLYRANVQLWTYGKSWEEEVEALWEYRYFGAVIQQQFFLGDVTQEIVANISDPKERIKAILTYIKSNVEWDGVNDCYAYKPQTIVKEKSGSSGDINLMLISMLAKSQINVTPILLSTRNNGHVHEGLPSLAQFNYVIAEAVVGKDTLYLDATQRSLPYDCLPSKCINRRALNAAKGHHRWFTLKARYKEKITAEGTFTLEETGNLKGKLAYKREGYAASSASQNYRKNSQDYKGDVKGAWLVNSKTYADDSINNSTFQEQYDITISDHATATGERIYINPYVFSFEETNPFQSDNRNFPVEFDHASEKTLLCNITLPPGYVVDELPQSKALSIPGNGARATFNISSTGSQVLVMARVQINRTFFSPEDYHLLKEFYARIFSKQGEQIILKKAP